MRFLALVSTIIFGLIVPAYAQSTQQNVVSSSFHFEGVCNASNPMEQVVPFGGTGTAPYTTFSSTSWNPATVPNILIVGTAVQLNTLNNENYANIFSGISNGLGGDALIPVTYLNGALSKITENFYPTGQGFVMHSAQHTDGSYDHIDTYVVCNDGANPSAWWKADLYVFWVPYTGP